MPPPVPPSVNDGRMIAGKLDDVGMSAIASSHVRAMPPVATSLARCARIASREQLAILGQPDRARVGADQLDAVLLEHAAVAPARARR